MQVFEIGWRKRLGIKQGLLAMALCALAAFALVATPADAYAYDEVTAQVQVEVALSGDTPAQSETFTVAMEPADGETVSPAQNEVTITGAGTGTFAVSYAKPGEHHYTVTQTAGSADRWTYDTKVYDVTVYCMWNESNDTLYTEVSCKGSDGYKYDSCIFTNSYDAPDPQPTEETTEETVVEQLVKTGDAQMMLGIGAAIVAACACAGAAVALRRKRS